MKWLLSILRYSYVPTFCAITLLVWYLDERRSSLVEKDVENTGLNPEILVSLDASKIPQNDSSTEVVTCPSTSHTPCSTEESKYSELPDEDDPSMDISRYNHPRNIKGISVLTAMNKISFSMVSKTDKYITELAFLNPFSYDKWFMVHFGVYLATFYNYGDHIIYKISPLSPFYAVNLRNQDRLVKVNGFDVTCWSHSALVNFILHLAHNDQNRFDQEEKLTKFTMSIEFVKQGKSLGGPESLPNRVAASLQFIMEENGRISVASTSVNPVSVTYLNRTSCSLLKVGSSTNRYVKIEEVNSEGRWNSTGRGTVLRVTEGERPLGERNAEITFHEFDISPRNEPGKIVAMETFREGLFLHAANSTERTSLSLISDIDSSNIRNITSSESRLFRIFSGEGDILSKIIHIQSGLYLKAENGVVSLARPPIRNSMKFRIFRC